MIDRYERLDRATRLQYALMIILGGVCILAALAPITYDVKVAAVSVTFGITAGLWLSHLITKVLSPRTRVAGNK
ncbi:MAG: hypothetical protein V5A43_00740 [Haloarculaceae archaeon]